MMAPDFDGLADALCRAVEALRQRAPRHVVIQWWDACGPFASDVLDDAGVPAGDRAGLAANVRFYRDVLEDALRASETVEDVASAITATVAALHEWQTAYPGTAIPDAMPPNLAAQEGSDA